MSPHKNTETPLELNNTAREEAINALIAFLDKEGKNQTLRDFIALINDITENNNIIADYITLASLENLIENYPDAEKTAIIEYFESNRKKRDSASKKTHEKSTHRSNIQAAESLRSILPTTHVRPNNKLANEITHDFINEGEIELRVNRNGTRKEIITKAMLTYDDKNIILAGQANFTPYDREVHDAVVTLYVAGNEVVTPDMVYRAMNGMTESEYVSPQAVGAVTRSLDKSRRITVTIDFSQEAQAYKKNCTAVYEGYLLACDKITVSTGGRTKEAYKLLRKPILYDYAQISRQVISVPIRLLRTKEAVRSTDDVIVIRGYLLRQIEGMKSPAFKRSNKITFEGIYTELDVSTINQDASSYKNKTRTIRQHVNAILNEWTEQEYIKKHSQYREGKSIKGVTIIF